MVEVEDGTDTTIHRCELELNSNRFTSGFPARHDCNALIDFGFQICLPQSSTHSLTHSGDKPQPLYGARTPPPTPPLLTSCKRAEAIAGERRGEERGVAAHRAALL